MEKKLIDFDNDRYSRQIGSYELFKTLISQAISIFNSFGIGSFAPEDLRKLILFPEGYVINKTLESKDVTPLIEMGIAQDKIVEMLDMPSELPLLLEKISQLERLFKQQREVNHLPVTNVEFLLRCYHFNENNDLVINENIFDSCKRMSETFIETDEAKNLFAFAEEMISIYKKYDIKVASPQDNAKRIEYLFTIKDERPVVNISCILDMERRSFK